MRGRDVSRPDLDDERVAEEVIDELLGPSRWTPPEWIAALAVARSLVSAPELVGRRDAPSSMRSGHSQAFDEERVLS